MHSLNELAVPLPSLATAYCPTAECPAPKPYEVNAESLKWHHHPRFELATR